MNQTTGALSKVVLERKGKLPKSALGAKDIKQEDVRQTEPLSTDESHYEVIEKLRVKPETRQTR